MFVWKKFIAKKTEEGDVYYTKQAELSQQVYGELQDIKKELKSIKGPTRIKRLPRGESTSVPKRASKISNPTTGSDATLKMD